MDDLYNLLEVAPGASPEEIRSAFRRQAKRVHPDAHPGLTPRQRDEHNRLFIGLAQAYETLSDPERRAAYDRQRAAAGSASARHAAPAGASGAARAGGAAAAGRSDRRGASAGGRSAAGASPSGPPRPAPRPQPTPEQAMNDLAEEVERVLSRFGLDLRQPVEVIMQTLLNWARVLYRQVSEAWGGTSPSTPGTEQGAAEQGAAQQGAAEEQSPPTGGARASPTGSSGASRGAAQGTTQSSAGGPSRPAGATRAEPAAGRKRSQHKEDQALDEELASLKRRVGSDLAAGRPTGRPPTLEEQLAALKQRLGKQ